ncbi:MAG: SPFH domain-containing protein [Deltaproteobacteria bacterium]|nr:SPFH domain-containing protein [Deltaproteobacteria bacterium]
MSKENSVSTPSGWLFLPQVAILLIAGTALAVWGVVQAAGADAAVTGAIVLIVVGILLLAGAVVLMPGFFTLQPNEARVLILFGNYKGTTRQIGFRWANPFYSNGSSSQALAARLAQQAGSDAKKQQQAQKAIPKSARRYRVSLRARTLMVDKLKVNDKQGNPVEIAAVVVWRVLDTAQAVFDVDDYELYVATQSESALRHLATEYAYDHGEEGIDATEITLRSNVEEVSAALARELEDRLGKAGVTVEEARLTHLAYAPEIAQAMLRRQQAEAVIAARQKIVHGAVSMVDMALRELNEKEVVSLDDERRATMVSNLMVVLCGESEVTPVLNAGTLYT